jgi:F-type H+-transporting ATPase subunit delta
MLPTLEGYTAAVLGELEKTAVATLASELFNVHETIEGRSDLRAVVTDTSMTPASRSAVVRDLLNGKVSATALDLVSYATQHSPAQDVPGALSDLAHYVRLIAESADDGVHALSFLDARRRVSGFVDRVLSQLSTDAFAAIEDDLFRWARTIDANPTLRRTLVDRDAEVESRLGLTRALLEGKVSATSLLIASYVVVGGRPRDIVGTLDYIVDYTAKARNWRVARVWSARELDDASRTALTNSLASLTGSSVELQVSQDASLLGGVLIQVGDLHVDASTKGRLGELRDSVAAGRTTDLFHNRND